MYKMNYYFTGPLVYIGLDVEANFYQKVFTEKMTKIYGHFVTPVHTTGYVSIPSKNIKETFYSIFYFNKDGNIIKHYNKKDNITCFPLDKLKPIPVRVKIGYTNQITHKCSDGTKEKYNTKFKLFKNEAMLSTVLQKFNKNNKLVVASESGIIIDGKSEPKSVYMYAYAGDIKIKYENIKVIKIK